jgi:amino acid adenylation domain-containing protein
MHDVRHVRGQDDLLLQKPSDAMISKPSGRGVPDSYPLSPMQQGMLLHSVMAPDVGIYIQQNVWELHEALNVTGFQRAWQSVVQRHAVLRTTFHWEGGETPWQEVHPEIELPWQEDDWRSLPAVEREGQLQVYLVADRKLGFALSDAPPIRFALFRFAESDYRFVWTNHHVLLDGRSSLAVMKELFDFYDAFCAGKELALDCPRPFRDYVEWLQRQDFSQTEPFWRSLLEGFTASTPLIDDKPPGPGLPGQEAIASHVIKLSATSTAKLISITQQYQLTLNTILQGVWALLLSRYSGETDIVFGATRACRRSSFEGADSIVGLMINTVPVRVPVRAEEALLPWLARLRKQWLALREFEHTPLVEVQRWSEVPPGRPLFETLQLFEHYNLVDAAFLKRHANRPNREFHLIQQPNYPLTFSAYGGQEITLKLEYDSNRFRERTIQRMLAHLRVALESIADKPDQRVSDVEIVTATERQQLLVEWNATGRAYPWPRSIHQLFEERARLTPQATALVFGCDELSYGELNRRANQLGHYLRGLGVGTEALVGLFLERSFDLVVGILGILKAGAAYVPLDAVNPAERLMTVLKDAGATIVVSQTHLSNRLPRTALTVINLDADWSRIGLARKEEPESRTEPHHLAYVIYTSGSTGRPKGVMVSHQAIVNHLLCRQEVFPLAMADRFLQKASVGFDISVWEIFAPLVNGAQLVLARPGVQGDVGHLVRLMAEQQITVAHFGPAMLELVLSDEGIVQCTHLKRVFCGGEPMPAALKQRFCGRLPAELVSQYGPTEATVDATWCVCGPGTDGRVVPIGRPIANTRIYLLDRHWQPVPIGATGELYIGGEGLARGYVNSPGLTAERFVPDAFSDQPGARLFRTGDLARYLPDGQVEYVGRVDYQIKLRGFRLELGEIEAVLREHPEVRETLVVAREDAVGDKRLVAYVVREGPTDPTPERLRSFVQQRLPDYMVPAAFMLMERFPLSPNGKIDRRALPQPDWEARRAEDSFVSPRTPTEEAVAGIWAKVLRRERVGATDNFFALGGHSLLAARVISRLRESLEVELPLRSLFETPTVAGLAESIDTLRWTRRAARTSVPTDGPSLEVGRI